MTTKALLLFPCILTVLFTGPLIAQQAPTDSLATTDLQPVTVTAYRLEATDLATPLSITRIGEHQLQNGTQQLALDEVLSTVPGLFVQNGTNFAQDIRVSIRGFGARAQFGIRGVKILVDGFPESTPDGTAQVDAVDPGSLTGLSVIRSGTGGLYGNASGGYVSMSTMRFQEEEWGETSSSVGSYGFTKNQVRLGGGKANRFLYAFNGSFTQTDGYREHSAMKNYLVNGGFLMPIDSSLVLRGVVTYVNSPLAQDPGALTEEGVLEDRQQANTGNLSSDVGESLWQLRMGVSLQKIIAKRHSFSTSFFQTNRSFSSKLRSEIVEFQRSFTGGQVNYGFKTKPGLLVWDFKIGLDFEQQTDDRKRFNSSAGEQGSETLFQTETFVSAGLFFVQNISIANRFFLFSSLRNDNNRIRVLDKTPGDDIDSNSDTDYQSLNPSIGLSILLSPTINFFVSANKTFETPTLLELSRPPNSNLKPQRSKSLEMGYKFLLAKGRLRFEPTIFRIKLQDEITAVGENSQGQLIYSNTSRSVRQGVEVAFMGQFTQHWMTHFSYTYSDFRYDNDPDYNDNETPGLPNTMWSLGLSYAKPTGPFVSATGNYVSGFYYDSLNENSIDPYIVTNFRAGWSLPFGNTVIQLHLGVNNLLNEKYFANIRLNTQTAFEPAPLRNYFSGVKIKFG